MEMSYSYNQYFIRPNLVNNAIRELFDEAASCALTQLLPRIRVLFNPCYSRLNLIKKFKTKARFLSIVIIDSLF